MRQLKALQSKEINNFNEIKSQKTDTQSKHFHKKFQLITNDKLVNSGFSKSSRSKFEHGKETDIT